MIDLLKDSKPQKITGDITAKISAGLWIVKDGSGRKHRAESMKEYAIGAAVVVIDGQIVGTAGRRSTPTVYQV